MKRNGVTRLNAVLCESRRVDGKPRQEHIAYLAGIDGVWLDQPRDDPDANLKRHEFWEKVEKRLAPLANRFGSDDHHKIREQLNAKVPMADPTEAYKHQLRIHRTTSVLQRVRLTVDKSSADIMAITVENKQKTARDNKARIELFDESLDEMQELLGVEGPEYEHQSFEGLDRAFGRTNELLDEAIKADKGAE